MQFTTSTDLPATLAIAAYLSVQASAYLEIRRQLRHLRDNVARLRADLYRHARPRTGATPAQPR